MTRMTAQELRVALATRKGGNKRVRNAQPMVVEGIRFDSKREAQAFHTLRLRQRAGQIADLKRQVSIPLQGQGGPILTAGGRQARYVADFTFLEVATGRTVIADAKGHPTEIYLLKRAILAAQGITVTEL